MRRIDWPVVLLAVFKVVTVLGAFALGFWIWSMRIDYCMQQSDLAWWQCFLIMGR